MPSCAVIVPVYNEERSISSTLAEIRAIVKEIPAYSFEIICVNDGSSDRTADILGAEKGITVITHLVNRGYGAALRTALDYCQCEWVFITDADSTYPISDLPLLLKESENGMDMVVGARSGAGISSSPFKRIARWLLRKMVQSLTGTSVPDLNSGMRVFRHSLYQEFRHLLPLGFSFTSTITVASLYSGYALKYVPIDYSRRVGKSNIKPIRDFIGFTILIVRLASYFEPLSFFVPASFVILGIAILRGIRDVLVTNGIGSLAVILVFFSLQLFVMGVVTDVVVRRSRSGSSVGPGPRAVIRKS